MSYFSVGSGIFYRGLLNEKISAHYSGYSIPEFFLYVHFETNIHAIILQVIVAHRNCCYRIILVVDFIFL